MSENKQYSLPKFVVEQLTKDFSYSENELEKASDIYSRAAKFNYPSSNTGENWSKLVLNITEPKMVKKETPTFKISYWWSAAAIVVIGLTFVFLQNLNPSKEIVSTQTYKTLDEIKKITLEDGSTVHLNRFSNLTVNVSKSERNLELIGEAFFEVTHNAKPFLVETNAGFVEVLGTIFNVKNRKNLPLSVALVQGSVQFKTPTNTIQILPGECITQKDAKTFIKSMINEVSVKNWMQNRLVFEDKTLKEIIENLESEYNVSFEYNELIANEKLTITFENLTAIQSAELLSKTLNTTLKVK